ncbi:unnamed protein product [Hermetia illucens]|nr:unnamed protein product [Hermetia illucens]
MVHSRSLFCRASSLSLKILDMIRTFIFLLFCITTAIQTIVFPDSREYFPKVTNETCEECEPCKDKDGMSACPLFCEVCNHTVEASTEAIPTACPCGHRNKDDFHSKCPSAEPGKAQYAEFPWMVAIMESNNNKTGSYVCGGSLINPKVILTAAHCIFG